MKKVIIKMEKMCKEISVIHLQKSTPGMLVSKITQILPQSLYQALVLAKEGDTLELEDAKLEDEEFERFLIILEKLHKLGPVKELYGVENFRELVIFEEMMQKMNIGSYLVDQISELRGNMCGERKILLLFNLNETLLLNSDTQLPKRPYDLKVPKGKNCKYVYLRPGFRGILIQTLIHSRVKVGFYSSMMEKNMTPLINLLFKDRELSKLRKRIIGVYDTNFNDPDPQGLHPWSQKRNLSKIWSQKEMKEQGFNSGNTILIESDEESCKGVLANTLLLSPYNADVVNTGRPNSTYFMGKVLEYLLAILREADDVCEYLMENAFEDIIDQEQFCSFDLVFENHLLKGAEERERKALKQKEQYEKKMEKLAQTGKEGMNTTETGEIFPKGDNLGNKKFKAEWEVEEEWVSEKEEAGVIPNVKGITKEELAVNMGDVEECKNQLDELSLI